MSTHINHFCHWTRIGILLALTGRGLPGQLALAVSMLTKARGPAGLFTIGGILHGLKVRGMAMDIRQVVLGKLLQQQLEKK